MKKSLAIAVALISMCALPSLASGTSQSKDAPKKECSKNKKDCCKAEKKCDRKEFNPFEGITLSESQQAKIADLKAKPCKNKTECTKDSCTKKFERPDRRQGKRDYISKVKEILTPEQYVVFLENIVVNGNDMKKGPMHDGRHGQKGPRPQGGRPQAK